MGTCISFIKTCIQKQNSKKDDNLELYTELKDLG